jgi:hypothetical protein
MIYVRSIRQSVSQVSLKLIRDPLGLGLTPLQGPSRRAWAKFPRRFGPQSKRGKARPSWLEKPFPNVQTPVPSLCWSELAGTGWKPMLH